MFTRSKSSVTRLVCFLAMVTLSLLLLCSGLAEDLQTIEGYTIRAYGQDCVIVASENGCDENGFLTIPMKVGEYQVGSYLPSLITADTKYVVAPENCYMEVDEDNAPDTTLRFEAIAYTDFKHLSPELLDRLPDMRKGEYALVNFMTITVSRNGQVQHSYGETYLPAYLLPETLFGEKAYCLINSSRLSQQVDGWTYVGYNDDDNTIRLIGYSGEFGANFVIPEYLAGKRVQACSIETIPAGTEYVYVPNDVWLNLNEAIDTSFIRISYLSYESAARTNSWYLENIPNFVEGTDLICSIESYRVQNGSSRSSSLESYLPSEAILTELNGTPLLTDYVNTSLVFTCGDWRYTCYNRNDDSIRLLEYLGAPSSVMVIPEAVDGHKVVYYTTALFNKDTEYVYVPASVWCENKSDAELNYYLINYISYAEALKNYSYYIDEDSSFTEGTYAYTGINSIFFDADGYHSNSFDGYIHANTVLDTLFDAPVSKHRIERRLSIVSQNGEYTYAMYNDGIIVLSAPATDRASMLLIPKSVDGFKVNYVDLDVLPEEITEVLLPHSGSYRYNKLGHAVRLYSYRDYDMLHENGDPSDSEMDIQPGELQLSYWGSRVCEGSNSTDLVQDWYEYPSSVNGNRIHLNLSDSSVTTYTSGLFTYFKLSETEAAICSFSDKEARKVVVPSELDGLTVTAIHGLGYNTAINVSDATDIILPDTLRVLGDRAISSSKLKALTLPAGLEEIGYRSIYAYYLKTLKLPASIKVLGCRFIDSWSLKSLAIPDGVTTIKCNAFSDLNGLSDIKLPNSVTYIGEGAFKNNYSLKTVTLPAGLIEIPKELFMNCERLQKITIPASVTVIGDHAFNNCKRMASLTFAGDQVRVIGESAFVDCAALGRVNLPASVEIINRQAFCGCIKVKNIDIPASVTTIGTDAFTNCKSLAAVSMGAQVESIAESAFDGCAKRLTFTVKADSYAHQWAESHGIIVKLAK